MAKSTIKTAEQFSAEVFAYNDFQNIALEKEGKIVKTFTLLKAGENVILQGGANVITVGKAAEAFLDAAQKNGCNLLFV